MKAVRSLIFRVLLLITFITAYLCFLYGQERQHSVSIVRNAAWNDLVRQMDPLTATKLVGSFAVLHSGQVLTLMRPLVRLLSQPQFELFSHWLYPKIGLFINWMSKMPSSMAP